MKHNSIAPLRSISPLRRTFAAIFIVLSIVSAFAAFGVQQGTSWTYQGQLQRSGAAYTGTCNFQFSLWDAVSAGTQLGATQPINSVNVVNGLFTVTLDFGDLFSGNARWLGTSVQCSGDGGFTPLDPRQPLTAAPYALSLRPGATISGGGAGGIALTGANFADLGTGIQGYGNGYGVWGLSNSRDGVRGESSDETSAGVLGENTHHIGVTGKGITGVYGLSSTLGGTGVYGVAEGPDSAGVRGYNRDSAAIWGRSNGVGSAIYGENVDGGYAGRFDGPVHVQGTLTKMLGSFKIDHPLDPANKFLSHSFVESPDMKNIYDGNVTTDATGRAIVTLPAYFEALNRDFRYQLTVLGQFAQAIVFREIAQNSFEIHTDKPGVKVSWQVTGIRQDAYAREHPIVEEEAKPAEQQGMYLYPAGFGAGEEKRLGAPSRPAIPQTEQKITKETK